MIGCWSPELAGGVLQKMVADILESNELAVVLLLAKELGGDDRDELLRVWCHGRSLIHDTLLQKLHYWTRIPHLIAALALRDSAQASAAARRILDQYDQVADPRLHHSVSLVTCGPFRGQVQAMADGSTLSSQPIAFQRWVARSRF
eukprot:11634693-Alexandrium_andersonii.AAC.1